MTSTRSTVEQLLPLERIGERSAQTARRRDRESRTQPLARLLVGLGISHVGPAAAGTLARQIGSLDRIATAPSEEIAAVEGVGGIIADSVAKFFANERNQAVVEKLRAAGVNFEGPPRAEPSAAGASFDGLTFVHHRHASRASRATKRPPRSWRGVGRSPAASRRRPRTCWRARVRAPSSPRRSSSESRSSTRQGSGSSSSSARRRTARAGADRVRPAAPRRATAARARPRRGARARDRVWLLPDRSACRRG